MDTKTVKKRGAPGQRRTKSQFRIQAEEKGWRMAEIADRWEITPLSLSRQTREPDQKTLDALAGLPTKRGTDGEAEARQGEPE